MIDLEIAAGASADLDDILRHSVDAFGMGAADRYFALIEDAIMRLRDFPGSGAVYPGITPPVRYATSGSHHIFYRVKGNTLVVLRVLHHAMRAQGRVKPR